jgi:hypothetical protein
MEPKDVWSCRANALKGTLLFRPWPYLITTEMKFDQTEMNELEVPRVRETRAGKPQFIPKFNRRTRASERKNSNDSLKPKEMNLLFNATTIPSALMYAALWALGGDTLVEAGEHVDGEQIHHRIFQIGHVDAPSRGAASQR